MTWLPIPIKCKAACQSPLAAVTGGGVICELRYDGTAPLRPLAYAAASDSLALDEECSHHECFGASVQVGGAIFVAAAYLSFLEVANIDYGEDYQSWAAKGREGPPPKLCMPLWPPVLRSRWISYYGTLIQYTSALLFQVGVTVKLIATLDPDMSHSVLRWGFDLMFLLGGAGFAVSGYLLTTEASHSWWRGTLPPLRRNEVTSGDYWVAFVHFLGSCLFFFGGIWGWFSDRLDTTQLIWLTAFSWLLGSMIFVIQGALMYLETVNPIW
jgi:hypothetical protein